MRFLFLTMDGNHAGALREAAGLLLRDQGVTVQLGLYDANRLRSADDFARFAAEAAGADFIFGSMLFGEEYIRPLTGVLAEYRGPLCVITSNPTLIRMTRMGQFDLTRRAQEGNASPLQRWMQKFRPKGGHGEGQRQLAVLRNLGKILKLIPGKARDLASYIAVHQYWMHSSPENLRRMLCMLIERYVPGYQGKLPILDPIEYPDAALLHPDAPQPFADLHTYNKWKQNRKAPSASNGTVGLLSLRTVALSGNTAHLDALVHALERRGLDVRMAYGAGLDFRPPIEQFFTAERRAARTPGWFDWLRGRNEAPARVADVDVLLNGAGFSLIGGMAESRPQEARVALEALDVAYMDLIPLSFQRVEEWNCDDTGLSPIQIAMNVAIPELDSAVEPLVIGGPTERSDRFVALQEQIELAAARIAKRVKLRRAPNPEKKIAIVLFNFPPTLGNAGTAAYLDVFASLHRLLKELRAAGYLVDVPETPEALRFKIVEDQAALYGTDGSVAARLPVPEYRRLFPAYRDIEPFWGAAPGELLNDGVAFHILGAQFGNIFVGLQPSFGYERDPMRLLMAKDAAPHHGFAAFYTWIEHVFGADAVLHFGTHGAHEFMPGKQVGLSTHCWPTRLLGSLPNFYYYSVNNPSEGTIARRRGAATLISYMVPPLQQAGLYKGLRLLKDQIDTYRKHPNTLLLADIRVQAERIGLRPEGNHTDGDAEITALAHELLQIEQRMIPIGLHVLGQPSPAEELADILALVATFVQPDARRPLLPALVAAGLGASYDDLRKRLRSDAAALALWERIDLIVRTAVRALTDDLCRRLAAGDAPARLEPNLTDLRRPGVSAFEQVLYEEAQIAPGHTAKLEQYLEDLLIRMREEGEIHGLLHALQGGYIAPSPGNDVVRNPAVVPTGRNIHALDPYRVPTAAAQAAGAQLACELLERLAHQQGRPPETIAMILWGTDNLKTDGEGVAQTLALLGARAVADELGQINHVELIPLRELGRPRIDVVVTVSGIFRDLLTHQMDLIDRAVRLAAHADEPCELNFVREHVLAQAAELQISVDEAATRVFSNAPGSYGANVNHMVESGTWEDDSQLAEAFVGRKCFAYGRHGQWREARIIMEQALTTVEATFQNIDSFELGISDIDHYYEYLGGITKSVERLRGERPPVFLAEALATTGRLSSLEQVVRMETRTRLLNPKWFEAMLAHGYQGVHEIESRVSNTYGWSATADAVEGWVYQGVAETFLLDDTMQNRLAQLNAHATAAIAGRLLEANSRGFWETDDATLEQLRAIYADLEDRLEGVHTRAIGG